MRPLVEAPLLLPTEPQMKRWTGSMARLGGVPQVNAYGPGFFTWLDEHVLVINDYPYAGMIFRDDFNLPLTKEKE